MPAPTPFGIPVDGPLDTANPESNRQTGTLVSAIDCAHTAIGPRPGRSRSATAQGLTGVGRLVYEFDGVDDYVLFPYNPGQMVLGLEWTLDLLFEPKAVGADSGTLFLMGNGTHQDIWIYLDGSGGAGTDQRTVVAKARASTSGGGSGNQGMIRDTTQRTLASAGTPAVDPTLMIHVRFIRSSGETFLYVNGVLTTSGGSVSGTVGHAYVGNGIYLGSKYADAGDFYGGWVYKAMLRNGVFTNLADGWVDTPHTKVPNVLFYATGGPASLWVGATSPAQELSRYRNYGIVTGSPPSDTITKSPFMFPVQGMATYTDRMGRVWNAVVTNGRLFYERAV